MLYELQIILLSSAMSGLFAFIVGKVVIKTEKNSIKQEIIDYIESQDALESVATMGAAFGHGLMTQLKFGNIMGKKSYFKIGPFKIPQVLVDAAVQKVMGNFMKTKGQPTGEFDYGTP